MFYFVSFSEPCLRESNKRYKNYSNAFDNIDHIYAYTVFKVNLDMFYSNEVKLPCYYYYTDKPKKYLGLMGINDMMEYEIEKTLKKVRHLWRDSDPRYF